MPEHECTQGLLYKNWCLNSVWWQTKDGFLCSDGNHCGWETEKQVEWRENEDRGMGWSILETLRASRGDQGGAPRSRKAQFPLGHLMLDWLGHIQIPDTRHPATKPAAWRIKAWGDLTAAIISTLTEWLKTQHSSCGTDHELQDQGISSKEGAAHWLERPRSDSRSPDHLLTRQLEPAGRVWQSMELRCWGRKLDPLGTADGR